MVCRFTKVDEYFYIDPEGNPYFSVGDFVRLNGLPDDLAFQRIVIEELVAIFPDVRILEEWKDDGHSEWTIPML